MARQFRGESVHKVDAKGRVSIPAAFRRVLEDCDPEFTEGSQPNLVLVYGDKYRKFMEVYSMTSMAEVDEKILKLPRGSKARRKLEQMYSGQAQQMQVDDTGRLVLSPKLREKFGITTEAFFIASGDTFQIWNPEAYDEHVGDMDDFYDEYGEDFDPLTLLDSAGSGG